MSEVIEPGSHNNPEIQHAINTALRGEIDRLTLELVASIAYVEGLTARDRK